MDGNWICAMLSPFWQSHVGEAMPDRSMRPWHDARRPVRILDEYPGQVRISCVQLVPRRNPTDSRS